MNCIFSVKVYSLRSDNRYILNMWRVEVIYFLLFLVVETLIYATYLKFQIAEIERLQQANMVTGPELNAIQALASRNFFSPNVIEGGTAYSHPDKKILHLGYFSIAFYLFPRFWSFLAFKYFY